MSIFKSIFKNRNISLKLSILGIESRELGWSGTQKWL